jgi:hypothetical protein
MPSKLRLASQKTLLVDKSNWQSLNVSLSAKICPLGAFDSRSAQLCLKYYSKIV